MNGKRYVGITEGTLEDRWLGHLSDVNKGSKLIFHCAIRKYGVDAFDVGMIEECNNVELMKKAEIRLINELNTFVGDHPDKGYNMTRGGDGTWGHRHSDETKQKQRSSARSKIVSDEARKNMSLAQQRRYSNPEMLENYRKAFASRDMSYVTSPEYAAKISAIHTGKKRPEGTGKRISDALKSKNIRRTEEQKRMISQKLKGNHCAKRCPVERLDNDGTILGVYETTYKAAQSVNKLSPGAIIACCKGRRSEAHGYIWRYAMNVGNLTDRVEV